MIDLTVEQLQQIYSQIERIDEHFNICCGFRLDRCLQQDEYNRLYDLLHFAGVPEHLTPFGREKFEEWLRSR